MKTKPFALAAMLLPFSVSAFDVYKDDDVNIKLGGRLQLDTSFPIDDDEDTYDFKVKRARIYIGGKFYQDWETKLQFDFAKALSKDDEKHNYVEIKDAWVKYSGLKPIGVQVGQFKAPQGLQELTSSKYISLLDRAAVMELAPSRKMGAGVSYHDDIFTATAGIFGQNLQDTEDDDGWGPTARLVLHPLDNGQLHLGASVDNHSSREENDVLTYGLEAASTLGPFHAQAEYMNQNDGNSSVDGWYAQGSYFLTGESRPYNHGNGYKGIKPKNNKLGAWEIAARYGEFNDDEEGNPEEITAGLNWYPNKYLRLSANFIHEDTDNDEDNTVLTRIQFAF